MEQQIEQTEELVIVDLEAAQEEHLLAFFKQANPSSECSTMDDYMQAAGIDKPTFALDSQTSQHHSIIMLDISSQGQEQSKYSIRTVSIPTVRTSLLFTQFEHDSSSCDYVGLCTTMLKST